jgi:hypothetical protein
MSKSNVHTLHQSSAERALILAEEQGKAASDAEACAREDWTVSMHCAASFRASDRTRDHVRRIEELQALWFAGQSPVEQEKILQDALRALTSLMSMDGFAYRDGVSIRPMDLYSDVLHLVSQRPRLWRQIALAGLRRGALRFDQWTSFAVVFPTQHWRGGFDPMLSAENEIHACVKAMSEPYPETLPDPSWAAGTRGAVK